MFNGRFIKLIRAKHSGLIPTRRVRFIEGTKPWLLSIQLPGNYPSAVSHVFSHSAIASLEEAKTLQLLHPALTHLCARFSVVCMSSNTKEKITNCVAASPEENSKAKKQFPFSRHQGHQAQQTNCYQQ
jgi:hypothetical protein